MGSGEWCAPVQFKRSSEEYYPYKRRVYARAARGMGAEILRHGFANNGREPVSIFLQPIGLSQSSLNPIYARIGSTLV
jgi:hypothetical protein